MKAKKLFKIEIFGCFLLLILLGNSLAQMIVKPGYLIEKYQLPSVAGGATGTSQTLALSGYYKGIIRNLSIASDDSTSFQLKLYNKSDTIADSINEILKYTNINKHHVDDTLNLFFANDDTTTPLQHQIYAIVVNDPGSAATGTMDLEIGIER